MKRYATVTVIGRDKTGVVARITGSVSEQGANIEALEEKVARGRFGMTFQASWPPAQCNEVALAAGWTGSRSRWAWRSRSFH